jgi:phenol 2-monooxygenase (NADPH)
MSPSATQSLEVREVDVLIAGSGSAGLAAATWLSVLGIPAHDSSDPQSGGVAILEKRSGPMTLGQADGVQCRTVEMFESFNISEEMLREAYHVLEVAFWQDHQDGKGLRRVRYSADTQKGLSWQPHVILNQARVNGLLLEKMKREGGISVDYGWEIKEVALIESGQRVRVVAENVEGGFRREWRAKYVLGADGAHSNVRRSLGYKMLGDSSDAVWGVMDVYPRTNYPDVRKKAILQCNEGVLMIVPREGGELARFYIEMPPGTKAKEVQLQDLHEAARKIFATGGYSMEISDTFWWSAYVIGQRLAEQFSLGNRVFLTGDACHTHSPKAGQGMNVSLQDGYNMGWKLGMVLRGLSDPSLLETYTLERGQVAADLIEFDRNWTKQLAARGQHNSDQNNGTNGTNVDGHGETNFSDVFIKAAKYTAGLTAKYADSALTDAAGSKQDLASKVIVGMRFPSAQAVRFCDAKAMQLARALKADGRWRLVVFAGDLQVARNKDRLDQVSG